MWQIRRIRLDGIGTRAARFVDVDIDLTSEGRGAPLHSILWLRNGGGKSTLIALLGALIRPARGDFISAARRDGGRHLEDYVLDGDTSHIVVEWGERDGRPRLVVPRLSCPGPSQRASIRRRAVGPALLCPASIARRGILWDDALVGAAPVVGAEAPRREALDGASCRR